MKYALLRTVSLSALALLAASACNSGGMPIDAGEELTALDIPVAGAGLEREDKGTVGVLNSTFVSTDGPAAYRESMLARDFSASVTYVQTLSAEQGGGSRVRTEAVAGELACTSKVLWSVRNAAINQGSGFIAFLKADDIRSVRIMQTLTMSEDRVGTAGVAAEIVSGATGARLSIHVGYGRDVTCPDQARIDEALYHVRAYPQGAAFTETPGAVFEDDLTVLRESLLLAVSDLRRAFL